MPFSIYVLGLMIFSMTTSEFMVAGIMPSLAAEFNVSIAAIGYLITAYAVGMIVGGPLLTIGLLKVRPKQAFMTVSVIFLMGQTLGAIAPNYEVMMAARIITGLSSAAAFGVSLAISFSLVDPESRGRASSIVIGGLMVATAIGVPLAMCSNPAGRIRRGHGAWQCGYRQAGGSLYDADSHDRADYLSRCLDGIWTVRSQPGRCLDRCCACWSGGCANEPGDGYPGDKGRRYGVTCNDGSWFCSLGVVVGSSTGGMTIDAGLGLASPLWVGAFLALLGLLSLLPAVRGGGKAHPLSSN